MPTKKKQKTKNKKTLVWCVSFSFLFLSNDGWIINFIGPLNFLFILDWIFFKLKRYQEILERDNTKIT